MVAFLNMRLSLNLMRSQKVERSPGNRACIIADGEQMNCSV